MDQPLAEIMKGHGGMFSKTGYHGFGQPRMLMLGRAGKTEGNFFFPAAVFDEGRAFVQPRKTGQRGSRAKRRGIGERGQKDAVSLPLIALSDQGNIHRVLHCE